MLSFVKICSTRSNHYSRVSCDVIMFLNQFLLNHRKKTLQIDLLKFFFYGLNSEFKTNSNNFMSRSYLPHSHRLFTRKRLVRFFCRGRITFRGKDCSPSYLFFQHTRKKKRVKRAQSTQLGQVFSFALVSSSLAIPSGPGAPDNRIKMRDN